MKLKSARVRLFRNILDSTPVEFQPDVTCLVGKNESGKTSFLNALYRLNPARPNVSFSVPDHYPAWLEKKHRQRGDVLEEVEPITGVFELEEADRKALEPHFGAGVITSTTIDAARNYRNELSCRATFDERKFVAHIVDTSPAPKVVSSQAGQAATLAELRSAVDALRASGDPTRTEAATAIDTKLQQVLAGSDLNGALTAALKQRLPKFFHYSEYSSLPGRVKIRELLQADPASLPDDLLTARSLLQLAAAENDYLLNPDYERRKRELENVANALTQDVLQYWTQNPELRVVIDVSQEVMPKNVVLDELKIRMWDERHWLSLPFDERSTGFRWFFSFLAAFSRYEYSKDPIVILLDEPALGLHARAQKDFLTFIDERLAKGREVIYTTHSPFMVQPGALERARIVEDKGKAVGSQISKDILSTDADTLFPLQGALGYDLVQHLFIGPNNLVVEGTSDFTYMTIMSDSLGDKRVRLDPKWSLVPVGGADLVPTFVALLGQHLDLTVVVDARKEGNQRLSKLADSGYLKHKRIITIGEIIGKKLADVEDLFAIDDYLTLYNAAFGKTLKEADLPTGTDPIVARLARHAGVDRFDHGRPADVFLRRRDEFLAQFSTKTFENFESLFKRINSTLGS